MSSAVVPAVSLIIVSFNVADYIRVALESALAQTLESLEIIVVDNASTDDGCRIVRDIAAASSRPVRLIENATNLGLGAARNQGIAAASGEYLAFLDGDDWLKPFATALACDAARKWSADVVQFDFARVSPAGRTSHHRSRHILTRRRPNAEKARARLLGGNHYAWSKLYRTAFIRECGFRFSDGIYEDMDWTMAVLMAAPRVACVPRDLVHYRVRPGSILRTKSPKHFDMVKRFAATADLLATSYPERAVWRRAIADSCYSHMAGMVSSDNRDGWAERVAFAAAFATVLRRLDPSRDLRPFGRGRLTYLAAYHGHARLFASLMMAARSVSAVKRIGRKSMKSLGFRRRSVRSADA